jgi:hypothetical protein
VIAAVTTNVIMWSTLGFLLGFTLGMVFTLGILVNRHFRRLEREHETVLKVLDAVLRKI